MQILRFGWGVNAFPAKQKLCSFSNEIWVKMVEQSQSWDDKWIGTHPAVTGFQNIFQTKYPPNIEKKVCVRLRCYMDLENKTKQKMVMETD